MLIFESKDVKTLGNPIILHKRDSTSFILLKTKFSLWIECIVYKIYQMKKNLLPRMFFAQFKNFL